MSSTAFMAFLTASFVLAVSIGLAALFAVSSLAFTLVKFAGAAYLVWLGVRMLRAPASGGWASGGGLIGLGVVSALADQRQPR